MKKLMVALAAMAFAVSVQASSVAWKTANDGNKTYANSTVYMILQADYADVITALGQGGTDIAKTMAEFNTGSSVVNLTNKGAGSGTKTDAAATDNGYYWVLVESSGAAIADGMTYHATDLISYATLQAAGAVASGAVTPTPYLLLGKNDEDKPMSLFTGASGTIGGAAPEPTTGLLMLVGLAGLALRRRRA